MPSDFVRAARDASSAVIVPEFNPAAITSRARAQQQRIYMPLTCITIAAMLVVATLSSGANAKIFQGIRFWLQGSNTAVSIQSLAMIVNPTSIDLRAVTSHASFPIVWPVGLPKDARIIRISYSPIERPSTVNIQYVIGAKGSRTSFTLVAAASIEHSPLPRNALRHSGARPWIIGREMIFPPSATLGARIRPAMQLATPQSSLVTSDDYTRPFIEMESSLLVMQRAERLSSNAHNVLLDRVHIEQIAKLASTHRPLLDTRVVDLRDIPNRPNGPDYQHAKLTWPQSIALDADAVRAVAAVLRLSPSAYNGSVLFSPGDATSYRIWTIPPAHGAAHAYRVDRASDTIR